MRLWQGAFDGVVYIYLHGAPTAVCNTDRICSFSLGTCRSISRCAKVLRYCCNATNEERLVCNCLSGIQIVFVSFKNWLIPICFTSVVLFLQCVMLFVWLSVHHWIACCANSGWYRFILLRCVALRWCCLSVVWQDKSNISRFPYWHVGYVGIDVSAGCGQLATSLKNNNKMVTVVAPQQQNIIDGSWLWVLWSPDSSALLHLHLPTKHPLDNWWKLSGFIHYLVDIWLYRRHW